MGMSAFPSFMTQATPATQPLINAEPAVAAQTEQNPQVGQVMPGVQGADAPVVAQNGPSRDVKLTFAQIAPPPGSMVLRGINPNGSIEFGMRSDEVVTKAMLNLEYTPSPSLLPVQSQLKVYLNDELMGVLPVTKEQLGKKTLAQMPINPLFITDFNRVRLEFVGHYQDVCENPTMAAAVRASATRRGHYLNDVLLPTGLLARQLISSRRKITHPAISCSTYVIPPPDGRVTWIYRRSR